MSEYESIGMVITVLVLLIGLFMTVHKPINENTKAMTALTIQMEQLKDSVDAQQENFTGYKQHVSVSQQKQWDVINEHSDMLLRHDMEIKQLKGASGNEK